MSYLSKVRVPDAADATGAGIGARVAIVVVAAAAGLGGYLATDAAAAARAAADAGADWAHLLRAMAALKGVFALAATAAVLWRLGTPASAPRFVSYAIALAAMWAGPGLIWQLVHPGWGALLLHGGLMATVLLLWRDPAVGARLSDAIARRRAVLRAR